MKKLIFSAFFLIVATVSQAQQVTELEEAKVKLSSFSLMENEAGNRSYLVSIKETYAGQFQENPIAFMKNNFDIQRFLEYVGNDKSDQYTVTFRSKKGTLEAEFGNDGELLKTRQNFKNIIVPEEVRYYLYKNHKGWEMVQNKYVASGIGDRVEKEVYHFKYKKGNKTKSFKLKPSDISAGRVASN